MAFQTSVAKNPSPGIEGGFAGVNPYFSLITPDEGMWVAGAVGPYVGRFAFANTANGQVTSAHPGVTTVRVGFMHRDQPVVSNGAGMLNGYSTQVVAGSPVDLAEDGVFWAHFAAGASIGQKVYTAYQDSSLIAAATGTPSTATLTANTTSGSPNLASCSTAVYAGEPVSGTGIPAGAFIVTGSAAGGTAVMSANATATGSGVTVTRTINYETEFYVRSTAGNGELAKISVRG